MIEGVYIKSWQDTKCLSLAKDSKITEMEHLEIPQKIKTSVVDEEVKMLGQINSVCITKHVQCTNCSALLDYPTEEMQNIYYMFM